MQIPSPSSGSRQPPGAAVSALDPGTEREWLSALYDGECPPERVAALLADCDPAAASSPGGAESGAQAWMQYHCLGEVLRSGTSAAPAPDLDFAAKVLARLEREPLPVAAPAQTTPPLAQTPHLQRQPANDPVFRWKLVSGLASFAAVVALALPLLATAPQGVPGGAQWASAPVVQEGRFQAGLQANEHTPQFVAVQGVQTPHGLLLRDPQLDAMLAAHRQHGTINALHTPAGFLRNATYEFPAH